MKSFLTGSRRYGVPTEDSDTDVVVFADKDNQNLFEVLEKFSDEAPRSASHMNLSFRFGKLNLIVLTDEEEFELWSKLTDEYASKPTMNKYAVKMGFRRAVAKLRADRLREEFSRRPIANPEDIPF